MTEFRNSITQVLTNRNKLGLAQLRAARLILGATLLLAVLLANIPTPVGAADPMCTLACCAGRAPHAAGSCMNGSCHAFLKGTFRAVPLHRRLPNTSEQLCGLSRRTARSTVLLLSGPSVIFNDGASGQAGTSRTSQPRAISSSRLGKPCEPGCGTGTFSNSSQSLKRNAGILAITDKLLPPPVASHGRFSFDHTMELDKLIQPSRPRGPPLSTS
jgi:hypothetical protein